MMIHGCPDCGRHPGDGSVRRHGRCYSCWVARGDRERLRMREKKRRSWRKAARDAGRVKKAMSKADPTPFFEVSA